MKLNKMREEMINSFIDCLKKDTIPWHRGWSSERPFNAVTNTEYHGANALWLTYNQQAQLYKDPRWCTFKQAQSKGWKIKQGSKGTKIEFWSLYDTEEKRKLTRTEAKQLTDELTAEEFTNRVKPVSNTYTVFNGEQIEGIPLYEIRKNVLHLDEFLSGRNKLIENMKVGFKEGGNEAFYSIAEDMIVLPKINQFDNEFEYITTFFHEAGHATGHVSRFNREMPSARGTDIYAREELRAEIASAFAAQTFGIDYTQNKYMENHEAYIQDYINVLENKPNELFAAIKDAEKISDYLIEKGEFELENVNEIINSNNIEQKNDYRKKDTELLTRVQDARVRMALKGQETAYSTFMKDESIPEELKMDSLNVGKIVMEYLNNGEDLKDIISEKTKKIDEMAGIKDTAYTKNLICSIFTRTHVEYMEMKKLPNLYDADNLINISSKLAEKLVNEQAVVFSTGAEENLMEIKNPKEAFKHKDEEFYITKEEFSRALEQHENMYPVVKCELSEAAEFDKGKFYTLKEYDDKMRNLDSEYVKGYERARARYGSDEELQNSNKPEDMKYAGYLKNKYTVIFDSVQKITELQDIGEGEGGIIEHFENIKSIRGNKDSMIESIKNEEEFDAFQEKVREVFDYEQENNIPEDFRTVSENMEVISREMVSKQYDLIADRIGQNVQNENSIFDYMKKNIQKAQVKNKSRGFEL
ncbi:DUF1738 domain-containing protein [Eubacterium sp. AF17-7]|uniref:ArdC family protein n=1 Tax=Eubacterium sp. AF17-7 TaxID=2293105 RepID=UPI000E526BF3|nr:zincin-like metallopeptidase domain-containing protein [Eubacterium sp. AF17-7]RGG64349.1 DUF1738 domain-containing protein [Eubacterium sp. AF17-7]